LYSHWEAAEIFPIARYSLLPLVAAQIDLLWLFADPKGSGVGGRDSQLRTT
jgi:hypothetical protein